MLFSDIIGQSRAVTFLQRALAGNRLAHGYIFTGPDGVGKTTTARAFASALLCRSGSDIEPCGRCSDCLKLASDNHPDLITVVPDGATVKISQIREMKKSLSFPPFEAGVRVVLIEDIQTMRREAGNSLLKVLEEPPPDNILLLIASESEPVLPTILSRCQVIPFGPLPPDAARRVLAGMYPDRSSEEIHTLVQLTGGCPGQLQEWLSEDILGLRRECLELLLEAGSDEALVVEQALALAVKLSNLKEGLPELFEMLLSFFKEVMTALLCPRDTTSEHRLARARERWNLQQLSDMVEAVEYARGALSRNCNRGLVCEVMLLKLLSS